MPIGRVVAAAVIAGDRRRPDRCRPVGRGRGSRRPPRRSRAADLVVLHVQRPRGMRGSATTGARGRVAQPQRVAESAARAALAPCQATSSAAVIGSISDIAVQARGIDHGRRSPRPHPPMTPRPVQQLADPQVERRVGQQGRRIVARRQRLDERSAPRRSGGHRWPRSATPTRSPYGARAAVMTSPLLNCHSRIGNSCVPLPGMNGNMPGVALAAGPTGHRGEADEVDQDLRRP